MTDKIELEAAGIDAALAAYADRLPFGLRDSAKGAEALRAAIADAVTAYLSASKAVPEAPVALGSPAPTVLEAWRSEAETAIQLAENVMAAPNGSYEKREHVINVLVSALETALASPPKTYEGPKVKELEWEQVNGNFRAETSLGSSYVIGVPYRGSEQKVTLTFGNLRIGEFPNCDLNDNGWEHVDRAKAAAKADYEKRVTASGKTYEDGLREAAAAGWNACRRSIYAVCEDVVKEADRIRIKGPVGSHSDEQHSKGYHAGSCHAAKSIARGFNAMEAGDDDNFTAAIEALIGAPK